MTDPRVAKAIRCPECASRVSADAVALRCAGCGESYEVLDGIPIMLPREGATEHKVAQAAFFDSEDTEWEIERPVGAPSLHAWLLAEKFRRSTQRLGIAGASVLTVCGGSGMDGEFLARAGARTVTTDLSLEACRRARERARRHDVALIPVVADVERLPFADRSFDVVYVHDGLHHLEDPYAGVAEMARVARVAVSITEPAAAAVTRLALRLGIAERVEEAGNPVNRLTASGLRTELERHDFRILSASRYAMFYRHRPGALTSLLSVEPLYTVSRSAVRAANAVGGRLGNKLNVQAVRA